eukprot:gene3379-3868_t
MGNTFALINDCKLLLKELPGILSASMSILIGITSILQDVEEAIIDVKEIIELVQFKSNMDDEFSEKAEALLTDAKQKIANAKILRIEEKRGLENIKTIAAALLEMKTRQSQESSKAE